MSVFQWVILIAKESTWFWLQQNSFCRSLFYICCALSKLISRFKLRSAHKKKNGPTFRLSTFIIIETNEYRCIAFVSHLCQNPCAKCHCNSNISFLQMGIRWKKNRSTYKKRLLGSQVLTKNKFEGNIKIM